MSDLLNLMNESMYSNVMTKEGKFSTETISNMAENYLSTVDFLCKKYEDHINNYMKELHFFDDKPFKLGQVVYTDRNSFMDSAMGVEGRRMGIIVGHMHLDCNEEDKEDERIKNCYRVYHDQNNTFLGTHEDSIEPLGDNDDIPDHLMFVEEGVYIMGEKLVISKTKTFK